MKEPKSPSLRRFCSLQGRLASGLPATSAIVGIATPPPGAALAHGSRLRFSLDDLVPTLFERRALPVLNQEVVDRPSAIER
jgi:hypothetical protein